MSDFPHSIPIHLFQDTVSVRYYWLHLDILTLMLMGLVPNSVCLWDRIDRGKIQVEVVVRVDKLGWSNRTHTHMPKVVALTAAADDPLGQE
jgi:hypothetical protein